MKTIKLTEDSYNKLVNEISHGLVNNADNAHYEIFYDMENAFSDFYDTVKYNADKGNPYVMKIKEYADGIKAILDKKMRQASMFGDELNKFDYEKFYGDEDKPEEWEEDYDNLDLRMLQSKYPK